MRIEFLHSAREELSWAKPSLRIGSAADNDLVLAANQAQPHHLLVEQERYGWVLRVQPSTPRVYVNARPVRECALLRAGDTLSIGDCRMLLCADAAPAPATGSVIPPSARAAVALRVVAGGLSGRVLAIGDGLELGPLGRHPLELPQGGTATLKFAWQDDRLVLEVALNTTTHPVRVNGTPVQRAALQPGDQISLCQHRFVLDMAEPDPEPEPVPAAPPAAVVEARSGIGGEAGWLILTAAVLAGLIALLLWFRF